MGVCKEESGGDEKRGRKSAKDGEGGGEGKGKRGENGVRQEWR